MEAGRRREKVSSVSSHNILNRITFPFTKTVTRCSFVLFPAQRKVPLITLNPVWLIGV